MKKVCVIGHFGFGKALLNGQTIKTKVVSECIEEKYGSDEVKKIDTSGGVKTLFKAPFQCMQALKNARNVIMFPAYNGVRVYAPLLAALRRLYKGRKLHYVVIGGWLPMYTEKFKGLAKRLKTFDCIYVETMEMKEQMEGQGFQNVVLMRNCKKITPLKTEELVCSHETPYRLCTFSRVMKEKGIEDAVVAVKEANHRLGKMVYELDIYGQVDGKQTAWFESLQRSFPDFVRYRGEVPFDKSVEVLKDYFLLLFPTRLFATEGIPGTVIDAYGAGVPVIGSRWVHFSEMIDEKETGIGYEMFQVDALVQVLVEVAGNPEAINAMKKRCLEKCKNFLTEEGFRILFRKLENE